MNRTPALLLAGAIFAVDQFLKYWVVDPLQIGLGDVRQIVSFFDLRFVSNCGVSLGLLQTDTVVTRWGLIALTGAIATGVLVWLLRERNRQDLWALGLILGGALGNIADRVLPPGMWGKVNSSAIPYPGCVIDYADLHFGEFRPFLVFNVADAAITIGVLILLVRALVVRDRPQTADMETN